MKLFLVAKAFDVLTIVEVTFKLLQVFLLAFIAIIASQPVDESAVAGSKADDVVKKFIESDDEEVHDMEGSELILKLIEKKIAKLTKKCYKLGGCGK